MNSAVGNGTGNVPGLKVIDRRLKVAEVILRAVICALGALAVALIASATQVKQIFTIDKKAKFTDMKALVFLVVASGIVATYSLIQCLRCVMGLLRGSVLFNKPLAWAIFSCDQVLAYLSLAALAAAMQSSVLAEMGQSEFQWLKLCNMYGKFCTQVGEGIASALGVSLTMVAISAISAFNLFRLYGSNKSKDSGRW